MKYNGLTYLIGEGFSNALKNKKATAASIASMIFMMFLFGIAFAIGMNINYALEQVQMKQGMNVFIWDETTEEQKIQLETEIKSLDGVNTVVFKTKQEALEDMKSRFKNKKELMAGFEGENNIFPASFVVTLTDLNKLEEIQTEIERIGAKIATDERQTEDVNLEIEETTVHDSIIKNITSSDNTIKALIALANGIKMAIWGIFIILLFASVMIISNTIKLTVHARRREISIMKYVGATNGFIRWPFVIEGIIIGVIAAVITLIAVGLLYDIVIQNIEEAKVLKQMGITLLSFSDIAQTITIVYAILGVGIGIVSSAMSMKKYLEV